ncbi:MAG: Nif3-like dinuclear metal center hexameric protein [Tidjanibacter sp.]|nr:Nif3-like dinuclear metal center hexameric protein [Tidjanibacter sp.]
MKVCEIVAALEAEVPLGWQESYDNAGLAVGNPQAEVERVLVALDVTEEVVDEAIEVGAQMIVSHHPIIFRPIKRLAWANRQQRTIAKAIEHGIALYAAHTNLDSAPAEGISHRLAQMLSLREVGLLEPSGTEGVGIGVVAEVVGEPMAAVDMLAKIKNTLGVEALRHSPIRCDEVQRVAICSGSGGSLIEAAEAAGADLYLSADFKYHDFVDADRMILVDAGHFETEICAIDILFEILSKKLPTFALHKSTSSINPVNYML